MTDKPKIKHSILIREWIRKLTIKKRLKKFLASIGITRSIYQRIWVMFPFLKSDRPFLANVRHTNYQKKCLILYITRPFTAKKVSDFHQNQPQAIEIARIISEFGYDIDVISGALDSPALCLKGRKYDFILNMNTRSMPSLKEHMNPGCKTAVYITGMNPSVAYQNESQRLNDLERRKGEKIRERRITPDSFYTKDIESLDAAWFIGNEYNFRSYDSFKMPPVYFIKNTGYNFSWLNKDLIRDKRNFLFFASIGQVHKGLDLLLDIFGEKDFPCNLYICSGFNGEGDFCRVYHHELTECPNIFPVGLVDIHGPEFREITEKCAFMAMPSCSEGIAGSALTTMSAGLIPIISRECGITGEIDDGVIHLPDCKIDTIRRYILECSQKPDEWIKEHSAQSIKTATTKYSFESFTKSVREAAAATLGVNAR